MRDEDIRTLLDRYPRLIENCERNKALGWYPSGGEVYKFTYQPSFEAVDRVADYLFGGIGYEAQDYMVPPTEFGVADYGRHRPEVEGETLERHRQLFNATLRSEYQRLMSSSPQRLDDWIALVNEPYDFGGIRLPLAVNRHWAFATLHALRVARRAIAVGELMRERQRSVRTVAEIGGGHGRATRDLVWMLRAETAFYIDLPLNMLLATRFLGHFFEDRLNLVWDEGDTVAEGKINIVAPWLIDRIAMPIDLLVNFLSFQHMSMDALRYYGSRLIEPRVQALYHENRDRPREGFDVGCGDYPFRGPFTLADSKEIFVSRNPTSGQVLGIVNGELLIR